ncbi:MAG: allantoate amidohydrolase [Thermoleophilaceae bacterium]
MAAEVAAPAARALMERADVLAACSEAADRLTRRFGTAAHAEACAAVSDWMRAAAMDVRRDAIGNVIGRSEGDAPDAPALLLGSHLDTVPDAGRYDGALGVLAGIAAVERLRADGSRLPFPLEVVAFADEEGSRFGTAYLGSSVLAGCFDASALGRVDGDGVSLEDAIRRFGGDPAGLAEARRAPRSLIGYAEVHIEQGPVLEQRGLPLGVVTGIAGQTRAALRFTGTPGHAGTVPMELRRDALWVAAEMVLEAETVARETPGLVATVGELTVLPGAANVIPGRADLTLDVRHPDDAARATAVARLRERAGEIAAARGVDFEWDRLHSQEAVGCDPELTGLMERAVRAGGAQPYRLASGAGHDAAMVAAIAPVTMLFVRCAGGVSHHPGESISEADVAIALDTLAHFVEEVAAR